MPYKAALSDPEAFRELRRVSVELCRQRRSLACANREHEGWEHKLAVLKEKLALTPDPAYYAFLQQRVTVMEELLVPIVNPQHLQSDCVQPRRA